MYVKTLLLSTVFAFGVMAPGIVNAKRSESLRDSYTVQRGDTLFKIARKHKVNVRSLLRANRMTLSDTIYWGKKIKIPTKNTIRNKTANLNFNPTMTVTDDYTVQRGDTLFKISKMYNIPVQELARYNEIYPPYNLFVGQVIRIPGDDPVNTADDIDEPINQYVYVPVKYLPPRKPTLAELRNPSAKTKVVKTYAKSGKEPIILPDPAPRKSSKFLWPVRGKLLSSFGAKKGGFFNDGINISASKGAAVQAAENGVVAYVGQDISGYGKLILVKHAGGWVTAYAHNSKTYVRVGQKVKRGQKIASAGNSGTVKTSQLHFEIRRGVRPVNPLRYMVR